MIRVTSMVVRAMPIPMVAPHAAQPIKANTRMMRIFLTVNPNISSPYNRGAAK